MIRLLRIAILINVAIALDPAMAQAPAGARPARPPARDPNTPGYVTAKNLPEGPRN